MFNRKIHGCKSNFGNLSTTKVHEHIPSDFSMSTISFKSIENKPCGYKCINWIKKLWIFQRAGSEDDKFQKEKKKRSY